MMNIAALLPLLRDEETRTRLGWAVAALLSPLVLSAVLILSVLSGTTQHNNAAVDLVFNGGVIPYTMDDNYAAQVQAMQEALSALDEAISQVNTQIESGTLNGSRVKAVFYSLNFGDEGLALSAAQARTFVDHFVRYEQRTRDVVVGTDEETGEPIVEEESYTVATPLGLSDAYDNLTAAGYSVTEELRTNAQAVYVRTAYGNGGSYAGAIEYGGERMTELDTSAFTDPATKNAEDLVAYAIHAWESGWGYVWGTYGNVLTESLLDYKVEQYPDGVGNLEDTIREKWLGGRTTDCVGLIKGYGWLDPETLSIRYGTNGMPDIGADSMYKNAVTKGDMASMPDTPGLAVWCSGHIGVYIGNGEVIEAMGTSYGVVKTQLDERNWTAWLEIPYIQYSKEEST